MARRTRSSDTHEERGGSPRARRGSSKAKAQPLAQPQDATILTGEILDDEPPDAGDDADLDPSELAEVEAALPALVEDDLDEGEPDNELIADHPALAPEQAHSLVKSDPLTAYMNEIRRYPLLSREEEHRLAVQYAKTRDPNIARRLIVSNLRLVVKLAHEYRRACRNLLDLIQEGNVGLLQAVQKYDPYRGVKLSSYAAWWIRAYMLKFILNNWRLVKIGTTQAQRKLFFNLSKERERLEAAGFTPTTRVLAERLSVPEREVAEMQVRLGAGEMSLDAPVGRNDEGGRRQVELLESSGELRPDVTTEGREFREMLRSKLEEFEKTLKGREQTLFRERLVSDNPLTLQEVGERYGISRERARQLEARLLARLKVFLKRELGDAVQVAMGIEE